MDQGFQGRRRSSVFGARACFAFLACGCVSLTLGIAGASVNAAPVFAPMTNYVIDEPSSIAIGDLNGDRKPDLATASDIESTVTVLINKGGGRFRSLHHVGLGAGIPYSVAIGDLNGDGKQDLATADAGADSVSVLLNQGGGTFQRRRDYATAEGPESRLR